MPQRKPRSAKKPRAALDPTGGWLSDGHPSRAAAASVPRTAAAVLAKAKKNENKEEEKEEEKKPERPSMEAMAHTTILQLGLLTPCQFKALLWISKSPRPVSFRRCMSAWFACSWLSRSTRQEYAQREADQGRFKMLTFARRQKGNLHAFIRETLSYRSLAEELARERLSRVDLLRQLAAKPCIDGCHGRWKAAAEEVTKTATEERSKQSNQCTPDARGAAAPGAPPHAAAGHPSLVRGRPAEGRQRLHLGRQEPGEVLHPPADRQGPRLPRKPSLRDLQPLQAPREEGAA